MSEKTVLTNSKANHENSDHDKADFARNPKIFHGSLQVCSDNTTGKGDDEAGESDHHCAVPFEELGPVLWVLGIIDGECNQFPIFHLTSDVGLDRLDDLASSCLGGILSEIRPIVQFSDWEIKVVDGLGPGAP